MDVYDAFSAPANPFLLKRKPVEEAAIVSNSSAAINGTSTSNLGDPSLVQSSSYYIRSPGQTGRWEVGKEDTVSVVVLCNLKTAAFSSYLVCG